MKRFTLTIIAVLVASIGQATTWVKTFGGAERDEGTCVQQTNGGGYIVTGLTYSFGNPAVWLIKLDSLGDTTWTKAFEGSWGYYVCQTSEGGYVIAAFHLIIKTDSNGNILWTKEYGGYARCIQETNNGEYIAVGDKTDNLWLIKINDSGDSLWSKSFRKGSYGDVANYVEQTSDSGYIIIGKTVDMDVEQEVDKSALWLLKTDAQGDTLWTQTYGGENWGELDRGNCVRQTDDGGYIITGQFKGYTLIKTDEKGDSTWTRSYGVEEGFCVEQTLDGGYIITGEETPGYTFQIPAEEDLFLIKTDANGYTAWTRNYGGENPDEGRYVQQTTDSGYIVTGYTSSFGSGGEDIYLLKTDSLGLLTISEEPALGLPENWEVVSSVGSQILIRYWSLPQGFQAGVYDVSGRKVDDIYSPSQSGTITWGLDLAPGVYFIKPENNFKKASAIKVVLVQ